MAEIQTIIGSLPVLRGEYDAETSYYRDNQVTMFGSTFQSVADDNVGNPPAEERDDGKVYAINTDKWIIVANALGAYNAGSRIDKLAENTEIKNEEGVTIKTPFREIESPEFLKLIVDAEDHVLFGIQLDGSVEWGKGIPAPIRAKFQEIIDQCQQDKTDLNEAINAAKEELEALVASVADTKVDKEDGKSLIDSDVAAAHSVIDNPEYLEVETDADGKVLSATNPDGSHYIHKVKSETIPEEFEHIEDPEGRMEITTDADDKILGYRDSEGTRHEYKMSLKHLELSGEAATEVNDAFKSAGIKMENPSDFSKESHVELPIPRIAAHVRIYASKLPTTKTDEIEAEIEYNDKDGNYFRKPIILNSQGSSSMNYIDPSTGEKGNLSIDINDGSEIKFGDFPTQDSFHLKKYYIDAFRGQCIVGYWLMEQVYKSRPQGEQYPYDYMLKTDSLLSANGKFDKDFFTGAKCHPDGFPIEITFINTNTKEEKWIGVYAWNLKKSKEVYFCDKKTATNIILDGTISKETLFGGTIQWNQFEIRNPKSLIDIDGRKYDGDNPKELSDTDSFSKKVKDAIIRLSNLTSDLALSNTQETFKKYLITDAFIDYILVSDVLYNMDGYAKNWIWCTWDGLLWCPTLYDVDSIFGSHWNGTFIMKDSDKWIPNDERVFGFRALYTEEIKARYTELRDKKVFDVDNIISLLNKWLGMLGYDNLKKDLSQYNETPAYRDSKLNTQWILAPWGDGTEKEYDETTTYEKDKYCISEGWIFRAVTTVKGVAPIKEKYTSQPNIGGCFNSVQRVTNWLTSRLKTLDNLYNYNK